VDKDSVPALDAVVTQNDDRKRMAIALVNRHPEQAARWRLSLGTASLPSSASFTVLSGDSPDAYNDVDHPNRVIAETRTVAVSDGSIEVPPHSVGIVQIAL